MICIYDVVQNAIKVFDSNGEFVCSNNLLEHVEIEGFITSDHENNIWFHDAINRRLLVFNNNCNLEYSIKYESINVLGSIVIRNGKPVFVVYKTLNINKISSANRYANMPVYNAELISIDEDNVLHPRRGVKTNRVYKVKSLSVSDEGEIVPPCLYINNEIVENFNVDESIIKNYYFHFLREDNFGNFYIYLTPNKSDKEYPAYLLKYNENVIKETTIELPTPSQHFGYACNPIIIDDYGNIFYMMLRDENIKLLKWTLK